jgi:hypothetical protein
MFDKNTKKWYIEPNNKYLDFVIEQWGKHNIKKEHAKELGVKWDTEKKKWYFYENNQNKDKILNR